MRYLIAMAALALCGCGGKELRVESTTSWEGSIADRNGSYKVSGSGNAVYEIGDRTCWAFQKLTEAGTLRVYAKETGFLQGAEWGDASTTAAYAFVEGCSGG